MKKSGIRSEFILLKKNLKFYLQCNFTHSYAEFDPLVLILSKIKESKTMSRLIKAGMARDTNKSHHASTNSNIESNLGTIYIPFCELEAF